MRACDVSCARYLRRLEASSGAELLHGPFAHGYARGVAESFTLSLAQLDGVRLDRDGSHHERLDGAGGLDAYGGGGGGGSGGGGGRGAVSARRVLDVLLGGGLG